jgi:cytosine/adenosine deaminase-related metal-dependent hydrolase
MESVNAGVRVLGEIATPPIEYPVVDSPMEMIHFCEVIGLNHQRSTERFNAAESHAWFDPTNRTSDKLMDHAAISPHAPYSTLPETIDRCVTWSAHHRRPLAMHVAESPSERELLMNGTGPMAESLKRLGVFDESLFPRTKTPSESPFIDLMNQLSACHRGLLIHCNDLQQAEIEFLKQSTNLSVVFCPRTHHHFGFDRHPVAEMSKAGINVALGTDSRASNPDLKLWGEVQFLLNHRQDLDPASVIAMATKNGADALGRKDIGRITVGSQPGLNTIATNASNVDQLYRDFASGEHTCIPS